MFGPIDAGTTRTYRASLLDDNGNGIPAASVASMTLDWTDKTTGTVINGRSAQNVLNANGVTLDGAGNLAWTLSTLDTILVTAANTREVHRALFRWTLVAGGTFEHLVEIAIEDPLRACDCDDAAPTALRSTAIVDLATIKSFLRLAPAAPVAITSLTKVGTLATAVAAGHGLISGQYADISGALQVEYNGSYEVTVLDASTFTYQFGGSATPTATGTLVVRGEDTSVDTILSLMGNGISEWIERECGGHVFQPRCVTEVQRGVGKAKVFLKKIPVASVDTLLDDGTPIAPSDFIVADPKLGMIELLNNRAFSIGAGKIKVSYTAGYTDCDTTGPFPSDATLLCLELVKAAYAELSSGAITFQSISAGPAHITVRPGLNPRHQRMLNGLRDTRI